MRNIKKWISSACVAAAVLAASSASALEFGLNGEFSGGTAPSGPSPWATATITDDGNSVLVQLSISSGSDVGKLSGWYLNYADNADPTALQISAVNASAVGNWTAKTGVNKFKADGDGTYDVLFSFSTSGDVFKAGEALQFRISSSGKDLNPEDFNYLSVGGARGSFHSAAHVQALSGGYSGWIGDGPGDGNHTNVPDGSWTVTLLGIATVSIEFLRRRFKKA